MSDAAQESAVLAVRKAINDSLPHFFGYRLTGEDRLLALDKFLNLFYEIQPHIFFTQQSIDMINSRVFDKTSPTFFQTMMNLTLFYHSRLYLTNAEESKLMEVLVDATQVTYFHDVHESLIPEIYINQHAEKTSVDAYLKNNRFLKLLFICVLYLNVEPLVEMRDILMQQQRK